MAVSITWKQGVSEIVQPLSHGQGVNGDTLPAQQIMIEHDGVNQISNCKFYIGLYSGTYGGGASAAADLAEMLAWGDAITANGFGGFWINMNNAGGWAGGWPEYNDKYGTYDHAFYTGHGDSEANGITLSSAMGGGMTVNGAIPAAAQPEFQCKVKIPTDETVVGIRQFDQKLRYTYTT